MSRLLKDYSEREKFLTEAMGECWHEKVSEFFPGVICISCGAYSEDDNYRYDFSTPEGFFKLWKWAQKQTWWKKFIEPIGKIVCDCGECNDCMIDTHWVDPDLFADIIYEFLITNNEV